MSENERQNIETDPGLILKAAREELSWTRQQVANELRLKESIISAIESNSFGEFESPVFLRGYFKAYCRLVNLHETRMVEILEQKMLDIGVPIGSQASQTTSEQQEKRVPTLTAFIIIAAVILTLYAYFMNQSGDEGVEGAPQNNPLESGQVLSPANSDTTLPVDNTIANQPSSQEDSKVDMPDAQIKSIGDTAIQTHLSVAVNESKEPEISESEPREAPSIAEQGEPISVGLVEFQFNGECWLELRDGEGKRQKAQLYKAGQSFSYAGKMPYQLVIGNASGALLKFNGKPVDLKPYTANNNRAVLTLGNE